MNMEDRAAALETKLASGEAKIDEEAGTLEEHDRQVIRVGTTVRVSTWDGPEVTDHKSVDAAKKAFKSESPG